MNQLDTAALSAVLGHLPGPTLAVAGQVCKWWRSVACSEALWQQQCHVLEPHEHLARDDLLPEFGGSHRAYYAWRWPLLHRRVQRIVVEGEMQGGQIATLPPPPAASQAGDSSSGGDWDWAEQAAERAEGMDTGAGEGGGGGGLPPGAAYVQAARHAWVQQAAPSPAGGLLAFTEMGDFGRGHLESRVVVADAVTGRRLAERLLAEAFPPFYYMWTACATRLLNWHGDVVALRSLDLAPALLPSPRPLGDEVLLVAARPLFLCVSPTSTRVLWHGSLGRLGLADAATSVAEDGIEEDCFFVNPTPCLSQAPQWLVDGSGAEQLLLPVTDHQPMEGEAGTLLLVPLASVTAALESEGSRLSASLVYSLGRQVGTFASSRGLCFAASPDGGMVAWCKQAELHIWFAANGATHRVFPSGVADTDAGAGAGVGLRRGTGRGAAGPGRPAHWVDGMVLAMQWSPDGRRLLLLVRKGGPGPMIALSKNPRFRWVVYDVPAAPPQPYGAAAGQPPGWLGTLTYCRPFNPSLEFLDRYLPFWDQYSRSMRLWCPASAAFCFASRGRPSAHEVSEDAQVNVQRVPPPYPPDSSGGSGGAAAPAPPLRLLDAPPPVWLARGTMASWSWQ